MIRSYAEYLVSIISNKTHHIIKNSIGHQSEFKKKRLRFKINHTEFFSSLPVKNKYYRIHFVVGINVAEM